MRRWEKSGFGVTGRRLANRGRGEGPGEGSCSVSRASIKVVGADETPPAGP